MKIVLEKNLFQTSLAKIQGIVERRSTIPILSNILITGENNTVDIVATDLEIGVKEITKATIIEKGTICIPARKIYDMVRELSENQLEIQGAQNFWISIHSGKTIFNLPGLDPKEFPNFPETEGVDYFNLNSNDLLEMIEKTVFSASTEESRFNLNGVYMENIIKEEKKFLRMVATDGHRLSLIDKEAEAILERGIILPRRGFSELRKILGDGETNVAISRKNNNCIFKTEKSIVVIRLLEGEFPDYQQVIPTSNDKQIVIDRKNFVGCLRRANVIASEKGEGVKFSIKEGKMEIHTGGPDVGEVKEEVEINYEGEPVSISFNIKYILDVLNILETEKIRLELKEESSAGVIKPTEGENYLYVIMPMRL